MTIEEWKARYEHVLPNGHIIHNYGTENEWESWKDSYGNEIQKTTVLPLEENTYISSITVRCDCPFCNEQIEVEVKAGAYTETECPECDKTFYVDMED